MGAPGVGRRPPSPLTVNPVSSKPSAFLLDCSYPAQPDFPRFAADIRERFGAAYHPAEEQLQVNPAAEAAAVRFDEHVGIRLRQRPEGGASARITVLTDRMSADAVRALLASMKEYVASELRGRRLAGAELNRDGGNADCFPQVPILRKRHLITCKRDDPAKLYDEPKAFFQCAGLEVEEVGDQLLVSRGLSAVEDREFLKLALPQAWELARAAKAGTTKYGGQPTSEELDLYRAAPAKLEPVGYIESSGVAEYTCYLEPEEHIAGWEIDRLHQMLREGRFSDGRPLRELRVSFPERAQAEREKRPLLDGGVKVLYVAGGAEHELTS